MIHQPINFIVSKSIPVNSNTTALAAHRYQSDIYFAVNPRLGPHKATVTFSVYDILVGVIFFTFRREIGCVQVGLWGRHYFP